LILVLLVLLVIWPVLPLSSNLIERAYSRTVYPILSNMFVPIWSALPFSVAGTMLVLLPILGIVALIISWRRWVPNFAWWMRWVWRALGLVALLGWWFVLGWGANYRREPLTTQLGLILSSGQTTSSAALNALRERFERAILDDVPETVPDATTEARALESVSRAIADVTLEITGVKPTLPASVKRAPAGLLLRTGNAAGVISPWTLEAHVDGALPGVGIIANGAHELAHVAGFALESDAEVLSVIAGLRADDAFARYAVALHWWSALRPTDAAAWQRAKTRLPTRAINDLTALTRALQRHQPPAFLKGIQRATYDTYLKTQSVPDGIQNYAQAVQYLVLALEKGLL
jgi:hypothetical protein